MNDERPIVLELLGDAELPDARLRLFAAALTAPASLVVLSVGTPGVVRMLVGVVGLLASVGWLATYRGASGRVGRVRATLTLRPSGFRWVAGDDVVERDYGAIAEIDLEDDAASLALVLRDGRRIVLEPGYGGLGTVSLHRLIQHHRDGANPAVDG